MKKILAAGLLLLYFTVSTGFIISLHYCMDRFDSAQLGSSQSDKCPKCGMHKDGGCCHDDVKVIKLQTAHMAAASGLPGIIALTTIYTPTEFLFSPFRNFLHADVPTDHGPPPLNEREVYLQNRVFRI
ncbi:MAG: hypothetical protein ACJ75B_11265 [Flavisolibacter sp.]